MNWQTLRKLKRGSRLVANEKSAERGTIIVGEFATIARYPRGRNCWHLDKEIRPHYIAILRDRYKSVEYSPIKYWEPTDCPAPAKKEDEK